MRDDMRAKMKSWHHNLEQKWLRIETRSLGHGWKGGEIGVGFGDDESNTILRGRTWIEPEKSSAHSWLRNLEIIQQWWPFDKDLLRQFDFLDEQGTWIIIYNIREDDEGSPELDFDTVEHILSSVRRPGRNDSRGVVGMLSIPIVGSNTFYHRSC
ncbi:uncharacterized protein LOC127240636 [Andrographis paniculata]|uniref:uncharacterized protein LOC127240636 n=1 Tax=Andrographis paniculata TaxID=175694 RepID=UPI0021E6FC8B|nr:uncharacterized protein LOC127240636 [Andrographis paniculata]